MATRLLLDAQTRRWLKLEVSRRRKENELHVGRPVLHRSPKHDEGELDLAPALAAGNAATLDRMPARGQELSSDHR